MTELLKTLFVTTPGTSLHLDGDALRVYHPDKPGRHLLPLIRLHDIVVFNGVTVSNDLMHRCAADGRSLTWLTRNGKFLARVAGPVPGNPHLRIQQLHAHIDTGHQLRLAQAMVAGKLHNYRQLLLRTARDATGRRQVSLREVAESHSAALQSLRTATSLDEVRGIEGRAARDYFQSLPDLAPGASVGRNRRPPTDPINCLLSFGYGLLRSAVHGALEQVGLDPYIGYLHGIRPAKPALALDLMEEFRPLLVDRLVLTLFNRGQIKNTHTETFPGGQVQLTTDGRKLFLEQWSIAREKPWPHVHLDREVPAALLPLAQARLLARHLRDRTDTYVPWTVS
ncbi:type I-C CRISPR-associated endonuclease Cas1 [Nocardia huaxiensis]|uniref:CRISPR-associated endonuclease Cas1 n=1 Tax=Nocardia huaxiensis TaxID=2755382 RepID=A0A7D6Z605_9NOCA|nr:type I-C CRISPR-associated endonuclease Cas1c [Nocardia huaxiensis]QLY33946.1 type I-C CRISPR-associated endonuclease Cas1 [Nocardia huaxiensis]